MISCVMPTFNQSRYIGDAIQSILDQTYDVFELIVVDDGSIDGTAKIVRRFHDPRIQYYWKPNGGTGTALNLGFSHAIGDMETWFASDNIMYPHNFQSLIDGLEDGVDMVYADCDVRCCKTGQSWLYSDRHPNQTIDCRLGNLIDKDYFPSMMWLWRKTLRENAGTLFSPMLCEDTDMFLRMEEVGTFKYLGKRSNGLYLLKNSDSLTGTIQPMAERDAERHRENARVRRKLLHIL